MKFDFDISGRAPALVASAIRRMSLLAVLGAQAPCLQAASYFADRPSIGRAEGAGSRSTSPGAPWLPDKAAGSARREGCRDRIPNSAAKHPGLADRAALNRHGDIDAGADEMLMLAGAFFFSAVVLVLLARFFGHQDRKNVRKP